MSSKAVSPIVAALEARRREMGISQRRLAEFIGTSQSHVSDVLTGRQGVSLSVIERMCNALDVHLDLRLGDATPVLPPHPISAVTGQQRKMARLMAEMSKVMDEMAQHIGGLSGAGHERGGQ